MYELVRESALHMLEILLDSSFYMLVGIVIAGLLKAFMHQDFVTRHLGRGRFLPVLKAGLLGVPLPLCSCGVLPAAASLQKQGANKGATVAFLISTPETGVDSIAVSYALLDPLMTVIRPFAALVSALVAGVLENLAGGLSQKNTGPAPAKGLSFLPLAAAPAAAPAPERSVFRRLLSGLRYGIVDIWGDIAPWFILGLILAGAVTALVPDTLISKWLGGGLRSMLVMLLFGLPLYICATASTPVAAALILKGVCPGAALVLLLVGPATNITSFPVLYRLLGGWGLIRYCAVIATVAVLFGLALDQLYVLLKLSPMALMGEVGEALPQKLKVISTVLLILFSLRPLLIRLKGLLLRSHSCCCG